MCRKLPILVVYDVIYFVFFLSERIPTALVLCEKVFDFVFLFYGFVQVIKYGNLSLG